MQRTIHIRRVYSLGDYKSITFEDTIEDIPNVFDDELIEKLRLLQMLEVDLAKDKYIQMNLQMKYMSPEEEIEYLEKVKIETLAEIKNLLNGNLKE